MDPELGMGIEFLTAADQQPRLEKLIQQIEARPESAAEVLVEPEGIDWEAEAAGAPEASADGELGCDGLLELFGVATRLSKEMFVLGLEQYKLGAAVQKVEEVKIAEISGNHRREPRLAVSLAVEMRGPDQEKSSPASLVDMSHRGARVDGVVLNPKLGEVVHLVSNGRDSRFLVIWVGEPGTAQEGQIGLQELGAGK
jgi:hypothetical protein